MTLQLVFLDYYPDICLYVQKSTQFPPGTLDHDFCTWSFFWTLQNGLYGLFDALQKMTRRTHT